MSFYEMNSITVNANELFDYSAIIHIKHTFIDPNVTYIDYCSDRFGVLKSIYINEDFGICYEFFDIKPGIYLKVNDHINITIRFGTQKNFMIVDRSINHDILYRGKGQCTAMYPKHDRFVVIISTTGIFGHMLKKRQT